jgi:hypothetical protein
LFKNFNFDEGPWTKITGTIDVGTEAQLDCAGATVHGAAISAAKYQLTFEETTANG